jgi:hypothetical protein
MSNSYQLAETKTHGKYIFKVYYARYSLGTEILADIYETEGKTEKLVEADVYDGNLSTLSIVETCKDIVNKRDNTFSIREAMRKAA